MPSKDARLLNQLLRLTTAQHGAAPTDLELLDRLAEGPDESAFRELLRRHAALVLGVCRRVAGHEQDAEDAFQAVFLILLQQAASIRRRGSLASWLHGVAYRCAARLRSANARRRRHEALAPSRTPSPPEPTWSEVRQAIDEELMRLPEKYRAPLVLCYLQGMTQCEAASELGLGAGVLRGRLDRGREQLRKRLARRGLDLSAVLLPLTLPADALGVAASADLMDATVQAAVRLAAGESITGVLSAPVAGLLNGGWQAMLWTKARIAVFGVLVLGALGLGVALAQPRPEQGGADRPKPGRGEVPAQPKEGEGPGKDDAPKPKAGQLDTSAKSLSFEMREQPWLKVFEWYADQTGLACVCNEKPTGTFTFIPSKVKRKYTLDEVTDIINEALLARRYILVRRAATFSVLPADEKVDPLLVPQVRLADLDRRAKTELVSVVVPLSATTAKALAEDVKKLLGTFGSVVVLEAGNRLVLQDTAGNLKRITEMIKEIDAQTEKKRATR